LRTSGHTEANKNNDIDKYQFNEEDYDRHEDDENWRRRRKGGGDNCD